VSKILVVEDDRAVRDVVEQSLCKEGLQTAGVADGEEALRYLRESNPIDVVVLDLMLPGEIDGYWVCRKVREGTAGEANKDLPVVMLTALP
jgi:CheY-like chemotaxis protein